MPASFFNGFLRDTTTFALITVDQASAVAPTAIHDGFLRDSNFSLVTTGTGPLVEHNAQPRDVNYNLGTVDQATAAAPLATHGGFVYDANGFLVTSTLTTGAAYHGGYVRDTNGNLLVGPLV